MLKHTVYKHFAKNKPKWIFSNAIALTIAVKPIDKRYHAYYNGRVILKKNEIE